MSRAILRHHGDFAGEPASSGALVESGDIGLQETYTDEDMSVLIAVAGRMLDPQKGVPHGDRAAAVPSRYIRALHRAGAHEAILQPVELDEVEAKQRLTRFDGLLLTGGGDLDPSLYGEERRPECAGIDPHRDAFELPLVSAAVDIGLPVFGICRGVQALNVALGGTLRQHIDENDPIDHGQGPEWVKHKVQLEPGSLISRIMRSEEVEVGSSHHQAIAQLGGGLKPTGWAGDGVIEAVEMEDGWVLGVQWHPELTAEDDPAQQRLFESFVEKAAEAAG
jgi:putative glutamine amidotransferase